MFRQLPYNLLAPNEKKALLAAEKSLINAYNPYSHFYVSAALYSKNGEIITGNNFENASYGATICAERSAIFRANAMGKRKFEGLAVIARGEDFDTEIVTSPCGMCRQVIYELSQISGNDLTMILSTTKKDTIIRTTINALLPLAFGPEDVQVDLKKYRK